MYFKGISFTAIIGLYLATVLASPVAQRQNTKYGELDYNNLFDGSLGTLPALWIVTQGALAGLNSTNSNHAVRRQNEETDTGRTDLEEGAVMGAFIGSLMTLPVKLKDDGLKKGLCDALTGGANAMASTVVSQESGKQIYRENTTSDDFEQGAVPGGFIGGPFGAIVGTTLSKTICDKWKKDEPGLPSNPGHEGVLDLLKSSLRILGDATCLLMSDMFERLGVNQARGMHFSQQVRNLLERVGIHGPANSVGHMTREMIRQTNALSNLYTADAAALAIAEKALAALATMSIAGSAALGIKPPPPSNIPMDPSLRSLQSITSHLSATMELAESLSATSAGALTLRSAVKSLHEQVTRQVADSRAVKNPVKENPEDESPKDEPPNKDSEDKNPTKEPTDEEPKDGEEIPPIIPPPPPPPEEEEKEENCYYIEFCIMLWICHDKLVCE